MIELIVLLIQFTNSKRLALFCKPDLLLLDEVSDYFYAFELS